MKEEQVFFEQLLLFTYTIIFLRYIRDMSLLNALFPILLISLTNFANNIEGVYFDVEIPEENESTLKALLGKTLSSIQFLFVTQSLYAFFTHTFIKLDNDVCRHVYGYFFTDLLGEFNCSMHGKSMLFLFDIILLLCQLQLTTDRLTRLDNGKRVSLGSLHTQKYGILSILRAQVVSLNPQEWEWSVSTPLHERESGPIRSTTGNVDYGSVR